MKNIKKKSAKKKLIVLGVLEVILIALFVFLTVWYFGASYPAFEKIARKEFAISGLDEKLSPQGICTLPENGEGYAFATSGYITDGSPSRVYLTGGTKADKYVTLTREGKPLTTHFGGLTCTGNYLLIASGKKIVRVSLAEALTAENGASIAVKDEFTTDIGNAYCYYDGEANELYVGEFYRAGNYETAESHHITANGETNYAFIYVYEADENKEGGVVSQTPVRALSVRGLVQGVAVSDGKIYLSTSYGLPDSILYTYSKPTEVFGSAEVNEAQVPLYRLDSENLTSTLTAPCMSEEVCIKDGRLYVLFESECVKYKYFVRTRLYHVYSIALTDLIG